MTNAIGPFDWAPASGHQLRLAGVHFDAVTGFRWMYFLLAPGEVRRHSWPLGVQRFGERGSRAVTYVGIPALDGNTWPLRWYSEPTPTAPYVDAGLLLGVVMGTVSARPASP